MNKQEKKVVAMEQRRKDGYVKGGLIHPILGYYYGPHSNSSVLEESECAQLRQDSGFRRVNF